MKFALIISFILGTCVSSSFGQSLDLQQFLRDNSTQHQPVQPQTRLQEATLPETLEYQQVEIHDDYLNDVAANFLIPKGWNWEGGFDWQLNNSQVASLIGQATNPEGTVGVRSLPLKHFCFDPTMNWQQGTAYQMLEFLSPITSPEQYIKQVLFTRYLEDVPRYRITQRAELPKVAKLVARNHTGFGQVGAADAQRIRFEYEVDGVVFEEDIYCCMVTSQGNTSYVLWHPALLYSFFAPKGQLDHYTPQLQAIVASSRATPKMLLLVERVRKEQLMAAGRQIQFARAWADQTARYADEMREQIVNSWREYQKAHDHMFQQFNDYIKDVERYQTSNGEAQLPAGYQHAWQSGSGSIVMTNSALFDPNVNSTQNWTQLNRVR